MSGVVFRQWMWRLELPRMSTFQGFAFWCKTVVFTQSQLDTHVGLFSNVFVENRTMEDLNGAEKPGKRSEPKVG